MGIYALVYMGIDGYTLSMIQEHLKDEGLIVSKKPLCLLIQKQKLTGSCIVYAECTQNGFVAHLPFP